jgi:tetratricopeptide (TPR) repeat protein
MAFPIAFYLLNLILISNLIGFNLGATMGERLIFHSSLGFSMLLGYGFYKIWNIKKLRIVAITSFISLIVFYCFQTWQRNKDWENDDTLFLADVKKQPKSMALNNNASAIFLFLSSSESNKARENQLVNEAKHHASKAISMNPNFVNALINLGICYGKQNKIDSAAIMISKVEKLYPTHPLLKNLKTNMANSLHANALKLTEAKDFKNAIPILNRALEFNNSDVKILYDLGVCYYNTGNTKKAIDYFKNGYQLDPTDKDIQRVVPLIGTVD